MHVLATWASPCTSIASNTLLQETYLVHDTHINNKRLLTVLFSYRQGFIAFILSSILWFCLDLGPVFLLVPLAIWGHFQASPPHLLVLTFCVWQNFSKSRSQLAFQIFLQVQDQVQLPTTFRPQHHPQAAAASVLGLSRPNKAPVKGDTKPLQSSTDPQPRLFWLASKTAITPR